MGEDAVSTEPAVVLNALAPSWQLWTGSKLSLAKVWRPWCLSFPITLLLLPSSPPYSTHPVSSAKVDSLGKIVALVEATVVSTRKGNDEFSCTLVCADNLRKKGPSYWDRLSQSAESWSKCRVLTEKGKPQGAQWQQTPRPSNSERNDHGL